MKHYAIYDKPTDYPDKIVVRGFDVEYGTPDDDAIYIGNSLDEARNSIPDGYINFGRFDGDDEKILEVWI